MHRYRNEKIDAAHLAVQQENYMLAKKLYREILHMEPENVCALDGLGVVFCQECKTEEGVELFQQALFLVQNLAGQTVSPGDADFLIRWEAGILFHLGLSYRTLARLHDALQMFEQSSQLIPPDYSLTLNLGQVYYELEQYPQAIEQFRRLSELDPTNPSIWLTLGFLLSHSDRYDEAADALQRAKDFDGDSSPDINYYLAEALRKAQRYEESLLYYEQMLPLAGQYPQAVFGYGKSLIALGDLDRGWDAMEFRLISSLGNWERHLLPNWSPESESKHSTIPVLAYSEEGIGAELMFASCLPDLINNVEHCVVECEQSLHSLFRRSFPRAEFVPLADDYVRSESNPWDIELSSQIAFGSLPRFFRRQIEDFPLRKAYLVPDRNKVASWSHRLAGLGDGKKIGILWSGSWTNEMPGQTSLPIQNLRKMLFQHQSAHWINLQHGSRQNEMHATSRTSPRIANETATGNILRIFPEAFQYDLDSMAALLTALDLVITPPGYIAHLAGALGVRTWMLVPECPDWRHTVDCVSQTRCVWHPSIKMYQQAKGQSWQNFFAKINDDLARFLTTYRPPEEIPATLAFPETRLLYSRTA